MVGEDDAHVVCMGQFNQVPDRMVIGEQLDVHQVG